MNLYFAIPLLPGGNLEWIIVVMAALMIFGSNLPEVALRAVAHVMRIRRTIAKMWQDTGLEDELRRVRRDIEMSIPREADFKLKDAKKGAQKSPEAANEARKAAERAREAAERNARNQIEAAEATNADGLSVDPDAHRSGEVHLEPAEGIVASGDWSPEDSVEGGMTSESIPDLGPDPGPAHSFDAAMDPAMDPAGDSARRDQIPGADRQEPTLYYEEEPFDDDEPIEAETVEAEPALEGPDVSGDHFGAGIKPRPGNRG
jgi:Sec-independent protein translocase protein TatA